MNIKEKIANLLGIKHNSKISAAEKRRVELMKEAFNTYGFDKPFTLDITKSLVAGYEGWWHTVGHNSTGDEKREEVLPIYKFTARDTVEVVGAVINEYDRVTTPTGLSMSGNRRKVKEVGLDEYKKMIFEHQQLIERSKTRRMADLY